MALRWHQLELLALLFISLALFVFEGKIWIALTAAVSSVSGTKTHKRPGTQNQTSLKGDAHVLRHEYEIKGSIGERNGEIINFFNSCMEFLDTFVDCLEDANCRIYYHHILKTGGTTMEARMFSLFPVDESLRNSCCSDRMMARFEKRKSDYCQAKFTSYQIKWHVPDFYKIVSDCLEMTNATGSRAIALSTYREPIQKFLSYINQICNKNLGKRPQEQLEACARCSYEQDLEVWDDLVKVVNRFDEATYDLVHNTLAKMDRVQVMMLETTDIDVFFELLGEKRKHLPLSPVSNVTTNKEDKSRCSFGLKSPILKALAPSLARYQNLTLGI